MSLLEKIFGTHSDHELKRIYPIVDRIEAMDEDMQKLTDEELRDKTKEFKERLANGETLDDILPEAFATVREAASRSLHMKHYRVQLIGGIVLHQGRIAEMRTGEGKTLVSTLPAYLNALAGNGVHIVTVNDYLAKRDAEWMGQVHRFLGLTVGVVLNEMDNDERREAYNCDITYVTNNELGFDYLRDNMVIYKEQLVQRGLTYAVIDEVDSVLIDEARTPLIISGQSGKSTKLYEACDILARQLERGEASGEFSKMNAIMGEDIEETGDFIVNEKEKNINLTEEGVKKVEKFFHIENLADPEHLAISVGLAMVRVLTGVSILWFLVPGYVFAIGISFVVPKLFTAIAFDAGGVASGPMTATFLLPLAQGACVAVGGNIVTDAFGVVAMVAMTPLITVQLMGLVAQLRTRKARRLQPAAVGEAFAGLPDDDIIEL